MASSLGAYGEQLAVEYLRGKHYVIKSRNFRARGGEIDIICQTSSTLVFVEVKTRIGLSKGKPYEAVTPRKISHLKKAVDYYLLKHNYSGGLRMDVISIELTPERKINKLHHFENVYD